MTVFWKTCPWKKGVPLDTGGNRPEQAYQQWQVLRGGIKAIDFHGRAIHLWVDTRGAQHWQLESASRLEPSKWSQLKILAGNERWQQLVLPHNEGMYFLRLVPMIGTDR